MSGTNGGRVNGAPKEEPVVGYLERVTIENVRSIASFEWEAKPKGGWNVILGDNGAGKSTFLRATAITLLGWADANWLRLVPRKWLRAGQSNGGVDIEGRIGEAPEPFKRSYRISGDEEGIDDWFEHDSLPADGRVLPIFSAGFGPFRRFTGGDAEYEKQFLGNERVSRHMSLFDERVSLIESLSWLKYLRLKQYEEDASATALLDALRTLVNQEGFLPNRVQMHDIKADSGVLFTDGNGVEVPVDELSDGYRSILSLTFELIRQLASHYGAEHVFNEAATAVLAPGIVLIDEVDAHLHPSWQRQIGGVLRRCFPKIQFIVTTHSPLICQAADVGTVFRLPRPGTDEEGRMVTGTELDLLLYGNLAEAYETDAIGLVGRSEKAQALLERLGVLNRKEIDLGLSDEERREQRRLQAVFPASLEREA